MSALVASITVTSARELCRYHPPCSQLPSIPHLVLRSKTLTLRQRWLGVVALIADLAMVGVASGQLPQIGDIVLCTISLVVFHHHEPVKWRRPSVVIAAGILCSALAWALCGLATVCGADLSWGSWLALSAMPWMGHLAAGAFGLAFPLDLGQVRRSPVRARHLASVLRATPGLGVSVHRRVGLPLEPPRWRPYDLSASWDHPEHGRVPLRPESSVCGMSRAVKRSFDLGLIAVGAPVLGLVTCICALIAFVRQGRPVFYSQPRVTAGGRSFEIWKIRTMVVDAEPEGKAVWPEEHDPRITPLGRILRRFWLDELPQAWNVARGDLSLIGPRPERPYFVQAFESKLPNYALRHQIKAGITGLAQVTGFTGNTSLHGRLRADLMYLRRWSPALDLWVLTATFLRAATRPPIRARH